MNDRSRINRSSDGGIGEHTRKEQPSRFARTLVPGQQCERRASLVELHARRSMSQSRIGDGTAPLRITNTGRSTLLELEVKVSRPD
jgi:hypothetical protein